MVNTLTYVLSTDTFAAGNAGVDIYENGPVTLTISFSGVNQNATYLKFIAKLPGEQNERVIQASGALSNISNKSIEYTFYPDDKHTTTYAIGLTGIRTNLQLDPYQVKLNLGRSTITNYKDLRIVNSHLYTNKQSKNDLLLVVESQKDFGIANVIIPFNKNKIVYIGTPQRIVYSNAVVLRLEARSYNGSFMPVVTEKGLARIVREDQLVHYVMGADIGNARNSEIPAYGENGIMVAYNTGIPPGTDINGYPVEEFLILIPENGIDYIPDIAPDNLPNSTYDNVEPFEILT